MLRNELFERIQALNLDPADYVTCGSGVLGALGIREVSDIDMVVKPDVRDKLESDGDWEVKDFGDGTYYLKRGIYEVGVDWDSADLQPNLEDLKADELVIEGIPFISLDRLVHWEKWKGRQKDLDDIKLIEEYRSKDRQATELQGLLDQYKDKRVVVVGTTCTGKSTFIDKIKGSEDMDKLVFPLLTQEENDYVCQTPWTPEIGKTMVRLTKERVKVEPGKPVFGTVVLDADLIVYLKISDQLLEERTTARNVSFEDGKNMQVQIEASIAESRLPVVEFDVG